MRLFTGYIVAALLAAGATDAKADTDYRCLSDCMHIGQTAVACMPQCTYGETDSQPPAEDETSSLSVSSTANTFTAPAPVSDIILPPSYAGDDSVTKDYQCAAECQHKGYQYELCDEQCVKASPPRKLFWESPAH